MRTRPAASADTFGSRATPPSTWRAAGVPLDPVAGPPAEPLAGPPTGSPPGPPEPTGPGARAASEFAPKVPPEVAPKVAIEEDAEGSPLRYAAMADWSCEQTGCEIRAAEGGRASSGGLAQYSMYVCIRIDLSISI